MMGANFPLIKSGSALPAKTNAARQKCLARRRHRVDVLPSTRRDKLASRREVSDAGLGKRAVLLTARPVAFRRTIPARLGVLKSACPRRLAIADVTQGPP